MSTIKASQLFGVNGLVAVITGGGTGSCRIGTFSSIKLIFISIIQGIGLMMANALAENGAARVYIVGRREEKLREAAKKYPRYVSRCPDATLVLWLQAWAFKFQHSHRI